MVWFLHLFENDFYTTVCIKSTKSGVLKKTTYIHRELIVSFKMTPSLEMVASISFQNFIRSLTPIDPCQFYKWGKFSKKHAVLRRWESITG